MIIRIIGVGLLFVIYGCKANNKEKSVSSIEENRMINKIRLKDLNGQVINLETYKGKTIFLNFWATWCKPCIQEMPSIEKAKNILHNKEVIFLMASAESTEEIDEFRNSTKYDFNYTRIENSEESGIEGLPTTYIFNAEGELVFSEPGFRRWDEKNNIDMILKIVTKNE
jgi:thiol-disulfide isomerase/thioredoxin